MAELDIRPSGITIIVIRGPDDQDMRLPGLFLEVVPNRRLVLTDSHVTTWEPSAKPFKTVSVTAFEEEAGTTRYTALARHCMREDREAPEKMGFHEGWDICADQLTDLVGTICPAHETGESVMPANFVWYELMTTDAKAAEGFYSKVVGWKAQDASQPTMNYTLFLAGEIPVAGLMTLPPEACSAGARPGWVGYVGVDDVDACTARVTKAGGVVHVPPTDIPNIGRFAMVADPQGAAFAVFKGLTEMPPPAAGPTTSGLVGWHELMAVDGEKAFGFYADLFGWTKADAIDMGAMGHYQMFKAGGDAIGGMMTKPAAVPMPFWTYYFQVDAIGAAMERLRQADGTVINGPMEVPGGSWIVQGLDPQGAMFSLVSTKA